MKQRVKRYLSVAFFVVTAVLVLANALGAVAAALCGRIFATLDDGLPAVESGQEEASEELAGWVGGFRTTSIVFGFLAGLYLFSFVLGFRSLPAGASLAGVTSLIVAGMTVAEGRQAVNWVDMGASLALVVTFAWMSVMFAKGSKEAVP